MSDRLIEGDCFTQVRLIQVYSHCQTFQPTQAQENENGDHTYITKLSLLFAGTSKAASRERQDRGRSPLIRPAGASGKGWVKNKGEFSGQRRTKSDVADN